MIKNKSLKSQFKKQFALGIGLMVIIFSILLDQTFFAGRGSAMSRSMSSMAAHYAHQIELNNNVTLPSDDNYAAFVGRENVPGNVESFFNIDSMEDHRLALNDGGQILKMFRPKYIAWLIIIPLKNRPEKLYFFYHNSLKKIKDAQKKRALGAPDKRKRVALFNVPTSIGLGALFAMFLVYWIIRRLIKIVLNPLNELAIMAKSVDALHPVQSFDIMKNETEIGLIANTLHQTMQRTHQYHQKEKQFLQNASHELRTPIAVVRSALDIIELRASQGNINVFDQHANIRRANNNMAELTEALLLLERKKSSDVYLTSVNLQSVLTALIDEHKYLLIGKKVDVELINAQESSHLLPLALCRIVLSNLIRNAFEHTLIGTVCVQTFDRSVLITNTNTRRDAEAVQTAAHAPRRGFGIGLNIVKKIVAQQHWSLELSKDEEQNNQVLITFTAQDNDAP